MKREILLERVQSQTRLAVLDDGRLCEIYYERRGSEKLTGNIYAGRVMNILPGMNAAFVDIGIGKNAFLYAGDICIDPASEAALKGKLEKRRIEKLMHPGQMIVCQVVKEPGGSKGPRISCSITLPGRYAVLLPDVEYIGISKKITDAAERDRLFSIAGGIAGNGSGIIVRTAGEGASEADIAGDYRALLRMWERIETEAKHSASPKLIQPDGSLTLRAMRDMADENVADIATDDGTVYEELLRFADMFAPEYKSRIRLEHTETPLFDLRRIDHQLEDAFRRYVYLKSGGTIVIDETEAMTVIDVNTGKFTGKKSLDETIFRINCEAAQEIARQLRLRDIGGIIIIDFIDMASPEEREALLERFGEYLTADRNRTNVLGITQLGLVEMTRRKVRRPLSRQLMRDCRACMATGREWTFESAAYQAVRELWRRRRMGDTTAYRLTTGEKTAGWIRTVGMPDDGRIELDISGEEGSFTLDPIV